MAFVRIKAAATAPFDLEALKNHARVDAIEDDPALHLMGMAAANEIEAHCEIALLRQTIRLSIEATTDPIQLPVGPLAPDAVVTINGEPVVGAISEGRYPVLTFPADVTGLAVVEYEAGYGDNADDIPPDLSYAILDQASRYYDLRGADDGSQGLSIAAARICARYRRVAV